MKITVLDGYGLNPGDLSWEGMSRLGELTVYDRTAPEERLERSSDSEILITNKTRIDADLMAKLPKLKYIGVLATGYNVVDIKTAKERGIRVTNIPAYSTMSVAQMVFALILAITNRVEHYAEENRKGRWSRNPDFCYWDTQLTELAGKTMGIVGLGNIGQAVARIALAFGMRVVAKTSKNPDEIMQRSIGETATLSRSEIGTSIQVLLEEDKPAALWRAGDVCPIEKRSLEELLREADIVTLHCPLTEITEHMINASTLEMMKPEAILINTGRGPLVDEQAVADALNDERLGAFGADVLSAEPPSSDNPLLSARNAYITPHIAWATREARERLMRIAVENLQAFIEGRSLNALV